MNLLVVVAGLGVIFTVNAIFPGLPLEVNNFENSITWSCNETEEAAIVCHSKIPEELATVRSGLTEESSTQICLTLPDDGFIPEPLQGMQICLPDNIYAHGIQNDVNRTDAFNSHNILSEFFNILDSVLAAKLMGQGGITAVGDFNPSNTYEIHSSTADANSTDSLFTFHLMHTEVEFLYSMLASGTELNGVTLTVSGNVDVVVNADMNITIYYTDVPTVLISGVADGTVLAAIEDTFNGLLADLFSSPTKSLVLPDALDVDDRAYWGFWLDEIERIIRACSECVAVGEELIVSTDPSKCFYNSHCIANLDHAYGVCVYDATGTGFNRCGCDLTENMDLFNNTCVSLDEQCNTMVIMNANQERVITSPSYNKNFYPKKTRCTHEIRAPTCYEMTVKIELDVEPCKHWLEMWIVVGEGKSTSDQSVFESIDCSTEGPPYNAECQGHMADSTPIILTGKQTAIYTLDASHFTISFQTDAEIVLPEDDVPRGYKITLTTSDTPCSSNTIQPDEEECTCPETYIPDIDAEDPCTADCIPILQELGSACNCTVECVRAVGAYAVCEAVDDGEEGECVCMDSYREDSHMCIDNGVNFLGSCTYNTECWIKNRDTSCISGVCSCAGGFTFDSQTNSCDPIIKYSGEDCDYDQECRFGCGNYAVCINGMCTLENVPETYTPPSRCIV